MVYCQENQPSGVDCLASGQKIQEDFFSNGGYSCMDEDWVLALCESNFLSINCFLAKLAVVKDSGVKDACGMLVGLMKKA
jgi:hypothetical protein